MITPQSKFATLPTCSLIIRPHVAISHWISTWLLHRITTGLHRIPTSLHRVAILTHHMRIILLLLLLHHMVVWLIVPHATLQPDLLLAATTLVLHFFDNALEHVFQVHQHGLVLGKGLNEEFTGLDNRDGTSLLDLLVTDVLDAENYHFFLSM